MQQSYTDDQKEAAVKLARELGDTVAAERVGVQWSTLYHWRVKADKRDGCYKPRPRIDFTEDERWVVRRYASEVNWGQMTFKALAELVSAASGNLRTDKSVCELMRKMGLRRLRRAVAEEKKYNPIPTVEERDEYFSAIEYEDAWQMPPVLEEMFDELIPKMISEYEAKCNSLTVVPQNGL